VATATKITDMPSGRVEWPGRADVRGRTTVDDEQVGAVSGGQRCLDGGQAEVPCGRMTATWCFVAPRRAMRCGRRENRDRLVAGLLDAQPKVEGNRETAKRRLADAEAKLRRFRAVIEAGIDPAALVEAMNEAHAQRVALRLNSTMLRRPVR
jgi:hypothetical protein